jgi:hypothetical protein
MTRGGPGRLPGDPRSGDRDFGAAGGFVDDVFFWIRDRERSAELEDDRLGRLGHGIARRRRPEPPVGRVRSILQRMSGGRGRGSA